MHMTLPLKGIKIIDLTRLLPGPYCSMILGDLGAEITRVEAPNDPLGSPPPFYIKDSYEESAFNSLLMRNKRSIVLNLKKERALEIFYKLIKQADVILESSRPGVAAKLKIDYETVKSINPSIIYCSLTGFGQTGPRKLEPGHDLNYLGLSGFLEINRDRKKHNSKHEKSIDENSVEDEAPSPIVPSIQSADISGSFYAAIGILSAIIERDRNDKKSGQFVDISMHDAAFSLNPMVSAYCFSKYNDIDNMIQGDFPFYTTYKTKDHRFMAIGAIEAKFWGVLVKKINHPELKSKQHARGRRRDKLFMELQEIFLQKTQDEWTKIFQDVDACVTPIKSIEEACKDPQLIAREMIYDSKHPKFGVIKMVGSPLKFSRTPLQKCKLAPQPGDQTDEILKSLGYDDNEIQQFREKEIVN
jgi:crotonobetainyl-CoA:carnitine CoA-transferase CaiB-like acyl-CoA transferase